MTLLADPLLLALNHIRKVESLRKKSVCGDDAKSYNLNGFTSRMKNFPSLLLDAGLIPAVTFYLSKVSSKKEKAITPENLKALVEYFEDKLEDLPKGASEAVKEDMKGEESKGYLIASAVLLAALKKFGESLGLEMKESADFLTTVVEYLEELRAGNSKGTIMEKLMLEYSNEMKRLVEAYSKVVWGGEESAP